MLTEFLANAATSLRPLRYAIETATYNAFYRSPETTKELMAWKDKYKNQAMLVVGNGPSLNQTPLNEFSHIPSVGLNKIDLLFPRTTWRPTVILCMNDVVVQQHWKNWLKLDIPVILSWKSRWFVPKKVREKFAYFLITNKRDFSQDFANAVGRAHSVTYAALQFAHWCGANPVIIFGVDHSFVQGDKADLYERRVGADVNHFDPNYFAAGSLWGTANLEGNESDYRLSLAAFEAENRRIYDATIGGKLEIFPKISLAEARAILKEHE